MTPARRKRMAEYAKRIRDEARGAGLCTTCRKRPRDGERCRCVECNAHRREANVRERALEAEWERREREIREQERQEYIAAFRRKKTARAAAKRTVEDRQQEAA